MDKYKPYSASIVTPAEVTVHATGTGDTEPIDEFEIPVTTLSAETVLPVGRERELPVTKRQVFAHKMGKKLVRKTAQMVDTGTTARRLRSPALFLREEVDYDALNAALNDGLEDSGVSARARVVQKWDGSVGDPGFAHFIELEEVDGQPVRFHDTPGWRK
ncbi:MAG TPA: hypothetical protein VF572_02145 [Candidatus Saccharimonadales bacterium]|jgi:hypothetical protein